MARDREEHDEIRRSVREFVEREVLPICDALDNADQEIPLSVIGKMAELGYFGLIFPAEYGGMGLDTVAMAIVTEELSRGWLSVGSVMTRMLITGSLILSAGTEEQKQRFLPRICSGELLTAAAFTEPDVGSDTAAMKLRAERHGDRYLLAGEKTWCTFANRAHVLTVLARTNADASLKHKGLSILLVEKTPGDGFAPPELGGSPIPTIGYKGMKSYSLQFDGFPCAVENLLGGEEGKGFYQLMATYEYARIQTAARAVGVAQASFEAALKYAQERIQFGKPIADFQVIRHKLAHAATEIEAARRLCYYASEMKDTGKRCDLEAGMAKVFAAEMAERVTSEMLQIFGGYGYSREYPAQRFWRDARVFRIFEGTSEIQYEVIAKRLLGRAVMAGAILTPRYGRLLGDFQVGATYAHPWEVTVDEGMVALYAASFQDASPLYASRDAARAWGFAERPLHPLLCLNLALSFSVHDVSEQAIAHLAYLDVRFPAAAHAGDTVRARSTVIDVKPSSSGDKGVVHVRTLLEDVRGRVLCAFERKALIRAGTMHAESETTVAQGNATPPLSELAPLPPELQTANARGRASLAYRSFEQFSPGQIFAHGIGHTVGESEHMQLTTLMRNSHPLHFDELYASESSFTKHRVVYGGLVFAWTAALASRDVAGNAVWDLHYSDGAHPASVAAGDTIYAASKVLTVEDRGNLGAVSFALVGVKSTTSRAAVEKHGDALFAAELGKKDGKIAEKVFEIRRTLLIQKAQER